MSDIDPRLIIWAMLSPVLAAVGVGILNYLLNYKAMAAMNKADHERIEAKADGLGKSFDSHCQNQVETERALSGTLAEMNTKLNLLVNGKINNN